MGLIVLLAVLVSAGLFVLCFFQPTLGSWVFIGVFIVGLEGLSACLILALRGQALSSQLIEQLTVDELDLINSYKWHFMYPGATRELSAGIAAVGLACLAFAPLLLWQGHYIEAGIVGANWFVAGPISHKLSPLNGLKGMADRGNDVAFRRLSAWDSAWKKILQVSRSSSESQAG